MMMDIIENLLPDGYSMKDILTSVPELTELFNRTKPLSYAIFEQQIDKDFNNIISITESGRQHHFEKTEDAMTEHLIVQLKQIYASVHHDTQHGGIK